MIYSATTRNSLHVYREEEGKCHNANAREDHLKPRAAKHGKEYLQYAKDKKTDERLKEKKPKPMRKICPRHGDVHRRGSAQKTCRNRCIEENHRTISVLKGNAQDKWRNREA